MGMLLRRHFMEQEEARKGSEQGVKPAEDREAVSPAPQEKPPRKAPEGRRTTGRKKA